MRILFYIVLILVLIVLLVWIYSSKKKYPTVKYNKSEVDDELMEVEANDLFVESADMIEDNNYDCDVGNCIDGLLVSNKILCDPYCSQDMDENKRNDCYNYCMKNISV